MDRDPSARAVAEAETETALADALDDVDGSPRCSVCPESADFFLHAPGRVATFACWEHVSPYAALVDGRDDAGAAREVEGGSGLVAERPVAVRLEDDTGRG